MSAESIARNFGLSISDGEGIISLPVQEAVTFAREGDLVLHTPAFRSPRERILRIEFSRLELHLIPRKVYEENDSRFFAQGGRGRNVQGTGRNERSNGGTSGGYLGSPGSPFGRALNGTHLNGPNSPPFNGGYRQRTRPDRADRSDRGDRGNKGGSSSSRHVCIPFGRRKVPSAKTERKWRFGRFGRHQFLRDSVIEIPLIRITNAITFPRGISAAKHEKTAEAKRAAAKGTATATGTGTATATGTVTDSAVRANDFALMTAAARRQNLHQNLLQGFLRETAVASGDGISQHSQHSQNSQQAQQHMRDWKKCPVIQLTVGARKRYILVIENRQKWLIWLRAISWALHRAQMKQKSPADLQADPVGVVWLRVVRDQRAPLFAVYRLLTALEISVDRRYVRLLFNKVDDDCSGFIDFPQFQTVLEQLLAGNEILDFGRAYFESVVVTSQAQPQGEGGAGAGGGGGGGARVNSGSNANPQGATSATANPTATSVSRATYGLGPNLLTPSPAAVTKRMIRPASLKAFLQDMQQEPLYEAENRIKILTEFAANPVLMCQDCLTELGFCYLMTSLWNAIAKPQNSLKNGDSSDGAPSDGAPIGGAAGISATGTSGFVAGTEDEDVMAYSLNYYWIKSCIDPFGSESLLLRQTRGSADQRPLMERTLAAREQRRPSANPAGRLLNLGGPASGDQLGVKRRGENRGAKSHPSRPPLPLEKAPRTNAALKTQDSYMFESADNSEGSSEDLLQPLRPDQLEGGGGRGATSFNANLHMEAELTATLYSGYRLLHLYVSFTPGTPFSPQNNDDNNSSDEGDGSHGDGRKGIQGDYRFFVAQRTSADPYMLESMELFDFAAVIAREAFVRSPFPLLLWLTPSDPYFYVQGNVQASFCKSVDQAFSNLLYTPTSPSPGLGVGVGGGVGGDKGIGAPSQRRSLPSPRDAMKRVLCFLSTPPRDRPELKRSTSAPAPITPKGLPSLAAAEAARALAEAGKQAPAGGWFDELILGQAVASARGLAFGSGCASGLGSGLDSGLGVRGRRASASRAAERLVFDTAQMKAFLTPPTGPSSSSNSTTAETNGVGEGVGEGVGKGVGGGRGRSRGGRGKGNGWGSTGGNVAMRSTFFFIDSADSYESENLTSSQNPSKSSKGSGSKSGSEMGADGVWYGNAELRSARLSVSGAGVGGVGNAGSGSGSKATEDGGGAAVDSRGLRQLERCLESQAEALTFWRPSGHDLMLASNESVLMAVILGVSGVCAHRQSRRRTDTLPQILLSTLFGENDSCGYVLKPPLLTGVRPDNHKTQNSLGNFGPNFGPNSHGGYRHSVRDIVDISPQLSSIDPQIQVTVQIISAKQLPSPYLDLAPPGSTPPGAKLTPIDLFSPFVTVSIRGHPRDTRSFRSPTINRNGFHPVWAARFQSRPAPASYTARRRFTEAGAGNRLAIASASATATGAATATASPRSESVAARGSENANRDTGTDAARGSGADANRGSGSGAAQTVASPGVGGGGGGGHITGPAGGGTSQRKTPTVTFVCTFPSISFLFFELFHQQAEAENVMVAANSFRVSKIRQGLRWVPLKNEYLHSVPWAGLMVFISIKPLRSQPVPPVERHK